MDPNERATELVDLYSYMRGTCTATDERLRQDFERALRVAENEALERAAEMVAGYRERWAGCEQLADAVRMLKHFPARETSQG